MKPAEVTRILIVDDSFAHRRFCRIALEAIGFETAEASDGESALAMLSSQAFDLVLVDLLMPVMDGYELLRRLPGQYVTVPMPAVIVCSSEADEAYDSKRQELNIAHFVLSKPLEPATLTSAVCAALSSADQAYL